MNFNTVKQELYKKIRKMSPEDFEKFLHQLRKLYYEKYHLRKPF